MNSKDAGRKHLPHLAPLRFDNQSVIIFVTQVVEGLARPEIVSLLLNSWQKADNWLIGRYVVMPDHLHFFCAPRADAPLRKRMQFWRSECTRAWPCADEKPIWQSEFFDRQLRSGESYGEKWHYVRNNPVRNGLAASADSWPWQGELNRLLWHESR